MKQRERGYAALKIDRLLIQVYASFTRIDTVFNLKQPKGCWFYFSHSLKRYLQREWGCIFEYVSPHLYIQLLLDKNQYMSMSHSYSTYLVKGILHFFFWKFNILL